MATRVVTVNDILDGHVGLDLECFDRIYLKGAGRSYRPGRSSNINGWVHNLQVVGQVVNFLTHHLGFPIPSPAILRKIGLRFRKAVTEYTVADDIAVIRFAKGERKLEVMRPHLDRLARAGRCGVAAIGVAQEFQRVFTGPPTTLMPTVAGCRGSAITRPTFGSPRTTSIWSMRCSGRRLSRSARIFRTRSRSASY